MKVDFLESHQRNFRHGGASERKQSDSGLFWWTILITILLAATTFCWFFSIYVFSHPEKPFNYRLLTSLEKIPPLRDFSKFNVPSGKFNSPKDLYQRFYDYQERHLEVKNTILKRSLLTNYNEEKPLYLRGSFEIVEERKLSEDDAIPSGVVFHGRAVDYPNVLIEYVMPSEQAIEGRYKVGDVVDLTGTDIFASIVHVERLPRDQILLSAISINYPNLPAVTEDQDVVPTRPPEVLNLAAGWPIIRDTPAKDVASISGARTSM